MNTDDFNNSLKSSLSQNLLGSLKLNFNSPLANTMITSLILMLFNGFFLKMINMINDYRETALNYVKNLCVFNRWNTITLQGNVSRLAHGGIQNFFSDRFITVQ